MNRPLRSSARGVFYRIREGEEPEFLILRRNPETCGNNKGKYQLSGGKIEPDEPARSAFEREAKEELGARFLAGAKGQPAYIHPICYLKEDGTAIFVHHGFAQEIKANTRVKRSPEHDQHKWVKYGDLKKYDFVKGAEKLIRQARKKIMQSRGYSKTGKFNDK